MNTFRCSNCGFQIQRPTQPFSCPQCGRQAVGLFRLVAFTPPAQGGWPGQPAQPGMQPGMPQQPAWPSSPGMPQQPACRQQPGMPQPGMPQQPGMPHSRDAPAGGWPAQPQVAAAAGQSLGTAARRAADAATAGRRWLARHRHASPACLSSPACRSRADGPRSRKCRSRRPIPGANRRRSRRRCRNNRPPAVGPASPVCRSSRACRNSRACRSRACRRRRRPGPVACSNRRPHRGPDNRRWAQPGDGAARQLRRHRVSPGMPPRYPQPPSPAMPQSPPVPQPPAQGPQQPPVRDRQPPQPAPSSRSRASSRRRPSGAGPRRARDYAGPHGFSTASGRREAAGAASAIACRASPPADPQPSRQRPSPPAIRRPVRPLRRKARSRRPSVRRKPPPARARQRRPNRVRPQADGAAAFVNRRAVRRRRTGPAERRVGAVRRPSRVRRPRPAAGSRAEAGPPGPNRRVPRAWSGRSRKNCFRKSRPFRFATRRRSMPPAAYSSSTRTASWPWSKKTRSRSCSGSTSSAAVPPGRSCSVRRIRSACTAATAICTASTRPPASRSGRRPASASRWAMPCRWSIATATPGSVRTTAGWPASITRGGSRSRPSSAPGRSSTRRPSLPTACCMSARNSATCLPSISAAIAARTSGTRRPIRATWESSAPRPWSRPTR